MADPTPLTRPVAVALSRATGADARPRHRLASLLEEPTRVAALSAADAVRALEELRDFAAPFDAIRANPLFVRLDDLARVLATRVGSASAVGSVSERDRLLTARDVHARTTLSAAWLYRHTDALPFARRIGRKVLFSERGLERWLASRRP